MYVIDYATSFFFTGAHDFNLEINGLEVVVGFKERERKKNYLLTRNVWFRNVG